MTQPAQQQPVQQQPAPTQQPAQQPPGQQPPPPAGQPAPQQPQPHQPVPGQPLPGQQPAPVPVGAFPPGTVFTPQQLAALAQPQPGQPTQPGQPATGTTGDDRGYPAGLSVDQMNTEQQLAYWRHYARHHEDKWKRVSDYDQVAEKAKKYDELLAANATDQEKAVAVARAEARQQALAEAGGKLVDAWIQAATAGRLPPESIDALLSSLNRQAFLTPDGQVDTAKVYQFVGQFVPQAQPYAVVAPVAAPVAAPGQQPPGQPPVPPIPGYPSYGYGQPVTAPVVAAPVGYPAQAYAPAGAYAQPGYPAAPAPDFGQGTPANARPSGLAAGRAIAAARFNKNQQPQTATASQQ